MFVQTKRTEVQTLSVCTGNPHGYWFFIKYTDIYIHTHIPIFSSLKDGQRGVVSVSPILSVFEAQTRTSIGFLVRTRTVCTSVNCLYIPAFIDHHVKVKSQK